MAKVVGIVRRIPGFRSIGRARTTAQYGSDVLMSLDSFHRLTTDPLLPLPAVNAPALTRIMATLTPDAVAEDVQMEIGQRYGSEKRIWAALAGIAAGATMAYLFTIGEKALQQQPYKLAVDTTVMPFIVVLVVLASVLGAAFSARRIVKHKAVEILRM